MSNQSVEVKLTKVVRVGGLYTLTGSEAFSGIETNMVIVEAILYPEDMDATTHTDCVQMWVDQFEDEDLIKQYRTEPYVQYVERKTEATGYLPISVFADHSVTWL